MTFPDAIQFLYSLRLFGAKLGLENTFRLAALAGNPQDRLRFIHVAGSNGKGSTCAMLESIYRAAGSRVGLFTSPHLVSFAERIQVNRELIPEPEVVRLVARLQPLLAKFPAGHHPTFFEVVTVMALLYFAEQQCELVLWETGLGGRLDATNIVNPLGTLITNIAIEHSEWLGDTFDKIAAEKGGIIKPGVPIVTGAREGQGFETIAAIAREKRAPLTRVDASDIERLPLRRTDLPLHGPHQWMNAASAAAMVRVLRDTMPVRDGALNHGLSSVYWPGRMQPVRTPSGQCILLDGAHNPAGAEALRLALESEFPGSRPTLVFGVFRDKDSVKMCHSLAPLAGRILLAPVHSERTEDPAHVVPACRAANPLAVVETCSSLNEALQRAADDPFVVIAGSLYLVGEAMELLHLAATRSPDEKKLNEWGVRP